MIGMLSAVNLDDKLLFKADKVGNVPADRLLPPEFIAVNLLTTKALP